ncbi:MAG TPA: TIR domain-containing protein [Steroidobacteraceae bacterium]|nr:TIR domain-containing protein [Steroidobacteraceae bacterium]
MADSAKPETLQVPAANATATAEAARVFISYASPDAAVAAALVDALERHGVACWIAPRDVDAGALYADAIVRAIGSAKAFVLVLSENSIDSSHVGKEVERASSKKRTIFALRIDAAPLTPALEYFLSESQWVEAQAGKMEPAYAKLIGAIRKSAPTAPGFIPPLTPSAGKAPAAHPRSRRTRVLLAAGLAIVAVALAVLLVGRFWPAKHGTAEEPTTAATNVVNDKSIAVLPFTDMSEKKDQGYFADGMAEEILDLLTKIPQLTVISRTSSFQFKGRDVDVKTIGATLGTRYIVEGSVRKLGDRFRITAQLIDTRDGSNRWSETYDRNIDDAFKVQDEIAASLVRALEIAVGAGELPARLIPKNAAAYNLYLRGLQAFDRNNHDGFEQAADLFQQALDLDPQFAAAASGLANVELFVAQWGYVAPKVGYERARQAAKLAINLDSRLAGPHIILSAVHVQYDWDWTSAAHELDLATALNPRDPMVHAFRGILSLSTGRLDDATSKLNAALRLEPLTPNILFNLGWARYWSGHLPEAEESFRRALQVSPTYESVHYYLGHVLLSRGDLANSLAEMERESDEESRIAGIASVQFAMGHKAESDAALTHLTKLAADDWASGIASVHAIRNEPDAAFEWLDRAYAQKDEDLYLIKGNPLFRNVARDPRYAAFLRKMNLPE